MLGRAYYDWLIKFSDPELDRVTVRANLEATDVYIGRYARHLLGNSVASAVVWVVVGTVIFLRRSDNWIALFASLCLITFGTFGLNEGALALPDQDSERRGMVGRIVSRYGLEEYVAVDVRFPDRKYRLFWPEDLEKISSPQPWWRSLLGGDSRS